MERVQQWFQLRGHEFLPPSAAPAVLEVAALKYGGWDDQAVGHTFLQYQRVPVRCSWVDAVLSAPDEHLDYVGNLVYWLLSQAATSTFPANGLVGGNLILREGDLSSQVAASLPYCDGAHVVQAFAQHQIRSNRARALRAQRLGQGSQQHPMQRAPAYAAPMPATPMATPMASRVVPRPAVMVHAAVPMFPPYGMATPVPLVTMVPVGVPQPQPQQARSPSHAVRQGTPPPLPSPEDMLISPLPHLPQSALPPQGIVPRKLSDTPNFQLSPLPPPPPPPPRSPFKPSSSAATHSTPNPASNTPSTGSAMQRAAPTSDLPQVALAWWHGPQSRRAQATLVMRQHSAGPGAAAGKAPRQSVLQLLQQVTGINVSGNIDFGVVDLGLTRQALEGKPDAHERANTPGSTPSHISEGSVLSQGATASSTRPPSSHADSRHGGMDEVTAGMGAMGLGVEGGQGAARQPASGLLGQRELRLSADRMAATATECVVVARARGTLGALSERVQALSEQAAALQEELLSPTLAPQRRQKLQKELTSCWLSYRVAEEQWLASGGAQQAASRITPPPEEQAWPKVVILGSRAMPAQPMFSVGADSRQSSQAGDRAAGGGGGAQAEHRPGEVVELRPGQEHALQVQLVLTQPMLAPLDSHRHTHPRTHPPAPRVSQGIHGQGLFVALCVVGLTRELEDKLLAAADNPQEKEVFLHRLYDSQGHRAGLLAVVMRHVGVVLLEKSHDMLLSVLNHKALEWIPAHLRILFDTHPWFFFASASPLPALFNGELPVAHVRSCAAQAIRKHRNPIKTPGGQLVKLVYLPSASVKPTAIGDEYCGKLSFVVHPLIVLQGLLQEEEKAMELDTRRWAVRNVRVRVAVSTVSTVHKSVMEMALHDWPPAMVSARKELGQTSVHMPSPTPHRYRGPLPSRLAPHAAAHQQLQAQENLMYHAHPPSLMTGPEVAWRPYDNLWMAAGSAPAQAFLNGFKTAPVPHYVQQEWMLVLQIPGLPEDRPRPAIGDVVYLRLAEELCVEYLCHVAWFDGDLLFLFPPPAYWRYYEYCLTRLVKQHRISKSKEPLQLLGPLVHVRFTYDRTPMARMHEALTTFMGLRHPFATYPPDHTAVLPLPDPILTDTHNLWSSAQTPGQPPRSATSSHMQQSSSTAPTPGFVVPHTPRALALASGHSTAPLCLQSGRIWRVLEPFLTTPNPEARPPFLMPVETGVQLPGALDFELSLTLPANKQSLHSKAQLVGSALTAVNNRGKSHPGAFYQPSVTPGGQEEPQVITAAQNIKVIGPTAINPEQRLAVATLIHEYATRSSPSSDPTASSNGQKSPVEATEKLARPGTPLPPVYSDNWPVVLFGPPGTGKTVTLVEAVLQLLQFNPATKTCRPDAPRMLLVAPQNFSADNMCERLARAGVPTSMMMSLNDPRRRVVEAVAATLNYCAYDEDLRSFVLPSAETLASCKVVVCSCAAAGLLREGRFLGHPSSMFDVVMMDEAGQALLPEALIPLALLRPGGRAMLCGDPQQLGPSIRSLSAASKGLSTSLLELLVRCANYCAAHNLKSPVKVIWLVRNYRSEARLLDLPSRLFYQGLLQPWADTRSTATPHWAPLEQPATETVGAVTDAAEPEHKGQKSNGNKKAAAPVDPDLPPPPACNTLFYGVVGKQLQESDTASYFNPVEASVVADLVSSLVSTTVKAMRLLEESGILKQCLRLEGRPATQAQLETVHTKEHIDKVRGMFATLRQQAASRLAAEGLSGEALEAALDKIKYFHPTKLEKQADGSIKEVPNGDIFYCGGTSTAAELAVGCALQLVENILNKTVDSGVAVIRPPGHHAADGSVSGFCFFATAAIAAKWAKLQGYKRIMIVDWDAHFGDGTEKCTLDDPDILFTSIHRDTSDFYPFQGGNVTQVGTGAAAGTNCNLPIRKGATNRDYEALFEFVILPKARQFKPDLVIVSAGFDAAQGDRYLLNVTPAGYAWMTQKLQAVVENNRVALLLEGGYEAMLTAECLVQCTNALLNPNPNPGRMPPTQMQLPSQETDTAPAETAGQAPPADAASQDPSTDAPPEQPSTGATVKQPVDILRPRRHTQDIIKKFIIEHNKAVQKHNKTLSGEAQASGQPAEEPLPLLPEMDNARWKQLYPPGPRPTATTVKRPREDVPTPRDTPKRQRVDNVRLRDP